VLANHFLGAQGVEIRNHRDFDAATCAALDFFLIALQHLEGAATDRADAFTLDSGVQRNQAHKFYFREGMTITSFHFTQVLSDRPLGLKR